MLQWSASGISCSWTPRLQRRLHRPIKQNKGGSKGEYLANPRVLRLLLSIYAFVSNGKGRMYIVDCKVESQNKDKKLGLSKTSIFRRVLQHEKRIANSSIA